MSKGSKQLFGKRLETALNRFKCVSYYVRAYSVAVSYRTIYMHRLPIKAIICLVTNKKYQVNVI